MKPFLLFLSSCIVALSCTAQKISIAGDTTLQQLQAKVQGRWTLQLQNNLLTIESKQDSWIDFYNSAGAPVNDPAYTNYTDDWLQQHGKKIKQNIVYRLQEKWSHEKVQKARDYNRRLAEKADSLIYTYKLGHLKRSHRYNEELIGNATPEEKKRFEAYKKAKAKMLTKQIQLPLCNSEKYSLFLVSRSWGIEGSYHMLPMISPKTEAAKVHELEEILDNTLHDDL